MKNYCLSFENIEDPKTTLPSKFRSFQDLTLKKRWPHHIKSLEHIFQLKSKRIATYSEDSLSVKNNQAKSIALTISKNYNTTINTDIKEANQLHLHLVKSVIKFAIMLMSSLIGTCLCMWRKIIKIMILLMFINFTLNSYSKDALVDNSLNVKFCTMATPKVECDWKRITIAQTCFKHREAMQAYNWWWELNEYCDRKNLILEPHLQSFKIAWLDKSIISVSKMSSSDLIDYIYWYNLVWCVAHRCGLCYFR